MKKIVLVLGAICTMTLVGCVSAPKSLYSWGEYPQQTYLMLSLPEKTAVPPGLYAHLGLLNLNINNGPRAVQYFELERQTYPESTVLMDRLLKKMTAQSAAGSVK